MSQNVFVAALSTATQSVEKKLTRLAFISRLNNVEYTALLTAVKSDIEVELWYEKFKLLDVVNLEDVFVLNGIYMMMQKSILTQERAEFIRTSEVLESEKPK